MLCLSLPDISVLGHLSHLLCDTWYNVPAALLVPLPSPVFLNIELSACQIKSLHCSKLSISEEEAKSESDLPIPYFSALLLLHSISFSALYSHGHLTIQSHQIHAGLRAFALAFFPRCYAVWFSPFPPFGLSTQRSLPLRPSGAPYLKVNPFPVPTRHSPFPCLLFIPSEHLPLSNICFTYFVYYWVSPDQNIRIMRAHQGRDICLFIYF